MVTDNRATGHVRAAPIKRRSQPKTAVVAIAAIAAVALALPEVKAEEFRTADGSGNNLSDPLQGSAGQVLRRNLDANFQ